MCRGTDRKKFREAFNDSQQQAQQVIIHALSLLLKWYQATLTPFSLEGNANFKEIAPRLGIEFIGARGLEPVIRNPPVYSTCVEPSCSGARVGIKSGDVRFDVEKPGVVKNIDISHIESSALPSEKPDD
jgi:hypothetical protein